MQGHRAPEHVAHIVRESEQAADDRAQTEEAILRWSGVLSHEVERDGDCSLDLIDWHPHRPALVWLQRLSKVEERSGLLRLEVLRRTPPVEEWSEYTCLTVPSGEV